MDRDNNFPTKYRPKTFSEVVGQETVKTVLKTIALADGVTCRSIFLRGGFGTGKTTLARIFSKALVCDSFKEKGDVCNSCSNCIEAQAQNSQIYLELDATTAGNVDSIRSLHEKLSYLPPNGLRRLVVIDEIHACSNSALNALLKLVEDGIPQTIFLFASTEDILPTLKSRSLCLELELVPRAAMLARLKQVAAEEDITIEDSVLGIICEKAAGHMRDAMSLLQLYSIGGRDAIKSSYNLFVRFMFASLNKDKERARSILDEILNYPTTDIVASVQLFIRQTYLADNSSPLYPLLAKGVINKIFGFFYNPIAQQAFKSEVGTELVLRSFIEKLNG